MRHVRRVVCLLAVAGLTGVAPPLLAHPAAAAAKKVALQASNFRFCAASAATCLPTDSGTTTTVKVGTTVSWTYADHACDAVVPCPGHDVVFNKNRGETKLIKRQGARIFRTTFRRPGTFHYFCTAHESFGMTGTIVVKR